MYTSTGRASRWAGVGLVGALAGFLMTPGALAAPAPKGVPANSGGLKVASETLHQAVEQAFDVSAEAADAADSQGAQDYQEVEQLSELEDESMQLSIVGDDGELDPELLAPFHGSLSLLHADLGYVEALSRVARSVPSGAALLDSPDVQRRLAATPVLGLNRHNHAEVRAYLDFFDGRGKRTLAGWIRRMGKFSPIILQTLREEGLPEDLVYVAMIESGFSPWARSPAAAVGLWQFIRGTGRDMGLRIDSYVDERRDPVKATRAAAAYLKFLHEKFGSWPLALAAYNGGPGLVARTIQQYNSNDYWYICRQNGLYNETRRYVPKVIAAALVSKNADIFGLDMLEPHPAWGFDTVQVPPKTRLSVVADAVGSSVQAIQELNPELLTAYTPPDDEPYALRIPAGTLARFVENFDKIRFKQGDEFIVHRVRFGESLAMIGEQFEVAPRVLSAVNGLKGTGLPPIGMELIVPKQAMGSWKPTQKTTPKKVILLPAKEFNYPGHKRYFYRVNAGDTLKALARGLGVSQANIVLWNHLDPTAKLQPNLYLQIFLPEGHHTDSRALAAEEEVTPIVIGSEEYKAWKKTQGGSQGGGGGRGGGRWHKVRAGESLWLIAQRYKTSVESLKRLNRSLRRSNLLQPGQKLLVHPGR